MCWPSLANLKSKIKFSNQAKKEKMFTEFNLALIFFLQGKGYAMKVNLIISFHLHIFMYKPKLARISI